MSFNIDHVEFDTTTYRDLWKNVEVWKLLYYSFC